MPTLPVKDAGACCAPGCCDDGAADSTNDTLTTAVREKYGAAARRVMTGEGIPAECCASSGCCGGAATASCDPITSNLYVSGETTELPETAVLASLGCGNPTALAELREGEVVLDLGSGGGIDVLLSARRVGPTGKAYGLDMTDDMLALARRNAAEANVRNVEFLRGRIEEIPLPGESVDVIISNCVINLSGDKRGVLREGELVLDLGSGGGIDVLLSARRVGPTGKAYGLDMTDDMLALARRNAAEANVLNVEFLRGRIEEIPLPGESVDVIISNCVINLSGDKRAVLREAFRVLKPGGRFAVSDVIVQGELPDDVKRSMELWVGCVAGALSDVEFIALLGEAGFEGASIEFTRTYDVEDAHAFLINTGVDADRIAREVAGRVGAAFVRATKPVVPAPQPKHPSC